MINNPLVLRRVCHVSCYISKKLVEKSRPAFSKVSSSSCRISESRERLMRVPHSLAHAQTEYKIIRNTDPMGRPPKAAPVFLIIYIISIYGYSLYIPVFCCIHPLNIPFIYIYIYMYFLLFSTYFPSGVS